MQELKLELPDLSADYYEYLKKLEKEKQEETVIIIENF